MAKRTDANQTEIVKIFRQLGASVWITSEAGKGAPDCVVGISGINSMVEIKDGYKPPSAQKLTPSEINFHQAWKGQICVINSIEQAIKLINGMIKF